MDALCRLDAPACDGDRSARGHAPRLLWFALCVVGKTPGFFSTTVSFSLFPPEPSGFFEFPMTDFYFVISKNDSQGDVFGRGFVVGYWVDSRAACFAVCANSCCTTAVVGQNFLGGMYQKQLETRFARIQ